MKHIVFPTVAQADAFVADMKAQGLVREDRQHSYRTGETAGITGYRGDTTTTTTTMTDADRDGASVGDEAIKGTAIGAATGAAMGLGAAALTGAAAAATVATGGLAAPLLGLTLLGSGVGAAVGAAGEAAREADDTSYYDGYTVGGDHYNAINEAYQGGGRAVAVDDNIPAGPLNDAIARHGGRIVG